MAHDVFICHSSRDKTVADAVCSVLESHGIRCWIAPRDILAGTSYAEGIVGAINEARVMVLVFSATANASQQVEREIERAVHRNMPLIPFRIEQIVPERALEYFLSTPHWLDAYTPPLEQHLATLATQVAALLGRPTKEVTSLAATRQGAVASVTPAPPARKGQNSLVLIAGAAVAVSVLVLAAVIFFKPFGGAPSQPAAAAAPVVVTATNAAHPASVVAATAPSVAPTPGAVASAADAGAPAVATVPVSANTTCRVADPTPTPLNIRASPGGAITGTIDNGQVVRVTDHQQVTGKAWALIDPVSGSPKAGWVFASFLDCPNG